MDTYLIASGPFQLAEKFSLFFLNPCDESIWFQTRELSQSPFYVAKI